MLNPVPMSDFKPKSDLIRLLMTRGYLHQATNLAGLDAKAAAGVVTGYIGFDATAASLHVGNMMQIMMLRRMQQTGHKPIVVMGGGTTKVGDPSGKDATRQLLTEAAIGANIASIRKAFDAYLSFGEGRTDAVVVNNAEWLDQFGYVQFLRDYGVHFTLNRMLSFDSVRLRLEREQPLTFLEFNYMLMQATDFLELSRRYGCVLQFGGSDQWGNIVNGVELIRRVEGTEAFGFTSPLVTTASGAKMGKTAQGAVWLNPDLRSPYAAFEEGASSTDLPSLDVPRGRLEAGVQLAALVADAGLAASRSEARRLAQGGGLRLNDGPEQDGQRMVTLADLNADGVVKLAAGRKKIVLVRPT